MIGVACWSIETYGDAVITFREWRWNILTRWHLRFPQVERYTFFNVLILGSYTSVNAFAALTEWHRNSTTRSKCVSSRSIFRMYVQCGHHISTSSVILNGLFHRHGRIVRASIKIYIACTTSTFAPSAHLLAKCKKVYCAYATALTHMAWLRGLSADPHSDDHFPCR